MNFIASESVRKLRGGYYTPADLASFLSRWVLEINPKRILEPSCGDGVFLATLRDLGANSSLTAFEIDRAEAGKAKEQAGPAAQLEVHDTDFLEWAVTNIVSGRTQFDAVVGNPPFIRYQYLPDLFQKRSEQVFEALHLPFTKHTNAWVPFVAASFQLLKPGGRLAMVVPSEIIHVLHAQALRTFLGERSSRLVIVDPEELWFEGTLQGAVLLLAEKLSSGVQKPEGLGIYPVKGREFLRVAPDKIFASPTPINGKTVQGKWTRALLSVRARNLLDSIETLTSVKRFAEIAQVDVGIVTGANKFFLVPDSIVEDYSLQSWAYPMFGRSEHCPGVIYDRAQHRVNASKGHPTNFLWLDPSKHSFSPSAARYIREGEKQRLHTRYKCRVRKHWYTVPSVYKTEIGMLKRSHDTPRLIHNKVGAYTTDTAYRIRAKGIKAELLVGIFLNPLTALTAELEGRHYGGGVLELVPSEIEKLLIPVPRTVPLPLKDLDREVRQSRVDCVLSGTGLRVLRSSGISKTEALELFDAWSTLRNRRQRISDRDSSELVDVDNE